MADINLSAPTTGNMINEKFATPILRWHTITHADALAKKGSAIAQNDVFQSVPVFAGEIVESVMVTILSPALDAATFTVGDGSGTASWISSVTADSAAGTTFMSNSNYWFATTPTGGKRYAANDTIDAKLTSSALLSTTFSMDVIVKVIPVK